MATAVINIRDYAVDRLEVVPRDRAPQYDPTAPLICQIELQFAAAADAGEEHRFRVALRIRLHDENLQKPANLPYFVTIHLQGLFETPLQVAPTAIPAPLVQNALTVLYGTARGIVGQVTSNFGDGAIVMPAVTFNAIVERASRDPATPVVPTAESLKPGDPAAAAFFRFQFAIEDLHRAAELLADEDNRNETMKKIAEMIGAMNALPADPDVGIERVRRAVGEVDAWIANSRDRLTPLLSMYVSHVKEGIEHLAKSIATQPATEHGVAAVTAGQVGPTIESVDESESRPAKAKRKANRARSKT